MSSFIFLCDITTEPECLQRNLLGTNPGEAHRDTYSKIKIGDRLFLYNFETGIMRGPFFALTACEKDIVPEAWRKVKRKFPWQVRIDISRSFARGISVDDFHRIVSMMATARLGLLPQPELANEKAEQLMAIFLEKNAS